MAIAWAALFLLFVVHTASVYMEGSGHRTMATSDAVEAGRRIWQERNCQGCHQLYGQGGYMGPDLTNVAGAREREYIEHFVRNGTGRMPAYQLSDDDVQSLIAFLAWIDASGRSRVPAEAVHWSGSYVIPRD